MRRSAPLQAVPMQRAVYSTGGVTQIASRLLNAGREEWMEKPANEHAGGMPLSTVPGRRQVGPIPSVRRGRPSPSPSYAKRAASRGFPLALGLRLEVMKIGDGALRMCGRLENRPLIGAEDRGPTVDI